MKNSYLSSDLQYLLAKQVENVAQRVTVTSPVEEKQQVTKLKTTSKY